MTESERKIAEQKLAELKAGKRVITNDDQLDHMLLLEDDAIYEVRSKPNPDRVGLRDQYVAWIGPPES